MGNHNNIEQSRRYQQSPFVCCGQQPYQNRLQEGTSNIINSTNKSKFYRESQQYPVNLEQTGSSYHQNQISLYKKPLNKNNQNQKHQKTFESQYKKKDFAKFQQSKYGAYNKRSSFGSYNQYGLHSGNPTKQSQNKLQQQAKLTKSIIIDQKIKQQKKIKKQKHRIHRQEQLPDKFIGQGQYSGRASQFDNNNKIIKFLSNNYIKQAFYKFYQTKDDTFIMNNSTIRFMNKNKAKNSRLKRYQQQQQQQSTHNIQSINANLQQLQQPIELIFQIDARIILATCLLIVGIVIIIIGGTVVYSQVGFFICIIIGIILYVCYVIICFIYNDVFMYLFNVRSFDQFEEDYQKLIQANGEFAYHVHLEENQKIIRQCYLLDRQNKYTRISECQNQNKIIKLDQVKNPQTTFLMIKYKTKSSFADATSQFNTIKYFQQFLDEHKNKLINTHKTNKNKKPNPMDNQKLQTQYKKSLIKSDFNYQLQPINNLTLKPQAALTVCYMQDSDVAGWMVFLFIVSTLLGLSIFFLCLFQAYTKRYRINILNRFKVR